MNDFRDQSRGRSYERDRDFGRDYGRRDYDRDIERHEYYAPRLVFLDLPHHFYVYHMVFNVENDGGGPKIPVLCTK